MRGKNHKSQKKFPKSGQKSIHRAKSRHVRGKNNDRVDRPRRLEGLTSCKYKSFQLRCCAPRFAAGVAQVKHFVKAGAPIPLFFFNVAGQKINVDKNKWQSFLKRWCHVKALFLTRNGTQCRSQVRSLRSIFCKVVEVNVVLALYFAKKISPLLPDVASFFQLGYISICS